MFIGESEEPTLYDHTHDNLMRAAQADANMFRPALGMTLRQWYAGQALSGIMAGLYRDKYYRNDNAALVTEAAEVAFFAALAMINEELCKGNKPS